MFENSDQKQYSSLERYLTKLFQQHEITKDDMQKMKPRSFRACQAYFLPKIHKPRALYNLKLRPIVSNSDSFNINLAKYLANYFKQLIGPNKIRDSFDFVNLITNSNINEEFKFVGLDIVSLYPSIPLDETIEMASDLLSKNSKLSKI